jgi:hypothetical protein
MNSAAGVVMVATSSVATSATMHSVKGAYAVIWDDQSCRLSLMQVSELTKFLVTGIWKKLPKNTVPKKNPDLPLSIMFRLQAQRGLSSNLYKCSAVLCNYICTNSRFLCNQSIKSVRVVFGEKVVGDPGQVNL